MLNKFPKWIYWFLNRKSTVKLSKITPFSAPPLECQRLSGYRHLCLKKNAKMILVLTLLGTAVDLTICVIELSYIITSGRSLKDHSIA